MDRTTGQRLGRGGRVRVMRGGRRWQPAEPLELKNRWIADSVDPEQIAGPAAPGAGAAELWGCVNLDELVEDALRYLTENEAKLFRLVYHHRRRASDVAVMLNLGTLQNVSRRVRRVVDLVAYYCRHMQAIRTFKDLQVENGGPLSEEDTVMLWACVVRRMSVLAISKELGCARETVHERLKRIRQAIEGCGPFERLVDDYFGGCYYMPTRREQAMEKWRADVRAKVLGLVGRVWYVWGGQDIRTAMVADCSGLVLEVFKACGVLPPQWQDMGARAISVLFPVTKTPKPGDLAFYGKSWPELVHVMICVGDADGGGLLVGDGVTIPNAVAGMTGGDPTFRSAGHSRAVGAGLWVRKANYRRDLLGYRAVSPKGMDA